MLTLSVELNLKVLPSGFTISANGVSEIAGSSTVTLFVKTWRPTDKQKLQRNGV